MDTIFESIAQEKEKICLTKSEIYSQIKSPQPDFNILFDGILHKIYKHKDRINSELQLSYRSISANCNPYDILDVNNPYTAYRTRISETPGEYFGFSLNYIKVKPYAFVLRSEIAREVNCLSSYAILGYNNRTSKWDILDEQRNSLDLIPIKKRTAGEPSCVIPINTSEYYSSFQVYQTDISNQFKYAFSLASIELHGDVLLKDEDELLLPPPNFAFNIA